MKEVIKCSIAGVAFTLDTDAYDTLRRYLDTLNDTYRTPPTARRLWPTSRRESPN